MYHSSQTVFTSVEQSSKILFRRFLPFALSFQLCSGAREFIGTYIYEYDAEFTLLRVSTKVSLDGNGAGAIPRMDKNAAIIGKFTLRA